MRLTNLLLVATATLLASCEAVSSATAARQTKLSMVASTEDAQAKNDIAADTRFLRTTKTEDYDEDDDDEGDEDDESDEAEDEERGLLDAYVTRHGQAWVDKWVAKANTRAEAGKSPGNIKDKYIGFDGGWRSETARDKYNLFNAAWLQRHKGGI
ncbi:hypothetical protein PHYBOEH_007386 [Phytophthora boehmeriae]|uniref:RxLR effector protein n=1 Tax=Phytophthora boehmeriae TaxID=109152 RepID=A0A8T1W8R4_9STRA|nr:hypothetical protein PHYBOEH_007386 [Phytophthora boehmeriae]